MPYNPGITYHGDQSLLQGMGALGGDIEKLFGRIRKTDEEVAQADLLVKAAVRSGQMGPEEYEQYQRSTPEKKKGTVGGLTIKFAQTLQEQQRQQQQQRMELERDALRQRMAIAQMENTPAANTGQTFLHPETRKPIGIYGDRGQVQFFPREAAEAGDGPIQVDPFTDPTTNKPVPGMGIVRKTGQIGYFGALLQGGGVPIETDPETGMKFYRDAKGNPKPLDPRNVMRSQMTQEMTGQRPEVRPEAAPSATPLTAPQVGEVRRGYKFKGGDPAKQESWEKVQ